MENTLAANAQEGIVNKVSPGRYSLLHDQTTNASKIEGEIREAADRRGVDEGALGLAMSTGKVEPAARVEQLRVLLQRAAAKLSPGADMGAKIGWLKQAIRRLTDRS